MRLDQRLRRRFVGYLPLVAVLATAPLGCREGGSEKREAAEAGALPPLVWPKGERQTYSTTLTTHIEVGASAVGSLSMRGQLEVAAAQEAASTPDSTWLELVLRQVEFLPAPGTPSSSYEGLRKELEGLRTAARFERGSLVEQLVPRELSPVAANLLRTLAGTLQFASGTTDAPRQELDSSGIYEAEYRSVGGASGQKQVVEKRKVRYVRLNGVARDGSGPAVPLPTIVESLFKYTLDGTKLVRIEATERLENRVEDKAALGGRNVVSLEFRSTTVGPVPGLGDLRTVGRSWVAGESFTPANLDEQFDPARARDTTFDSALAELAALAKETGGDFASSRGGEPLGAEEREKRTKQLAAYQKAYAALTAHLRLDPSLVPRAAELARTGTAEQKVVVLDALGDAATPETQRALLEIIRTPLLPAALRGDAATRLVRAGEPLEGTEEALLELARHDQLGEFGLFALGTMARRLHERGQSARAAGVDRLLAGEFERATSSSQRRRVLLGMSNAGSVALLPVIRQGLQAPDRAEAEAAVVALRLVEGDEADRLFAEGLRHAEPGVRRRALETLKARAPSDALVAVVVEIARAGDAADRVRAVRVLGRWRTTAKSAEVALRAIADGESSEQVRSAARAELPG